MTSPRPTLRKRPLVALIITVCGVIILDSLKIPWEENLGILLCNYEQFSRYFFIVSFVVIVFRLLAIRQKGIAPESPLKLRLLGPIFDLAVEPLFDASLFSSALFMLYSLFQERVHGLGQDTFFVLLGVAAILLYLSVNGLIVMIREIIYVQTTEKVVRE